MAFASVGARGTTNELVADNDFSMSPSASIPAGALLVAWMGWKGSGAAGPTGGHAVGYSCEDDAGNIYCTVFAGDWGDGGTIGGSGVIFVSRIRNALTTSSVLTFRDWATGGPRDAKCASLWEFSLDADKQWAVTGDQGPGFVVNSSTGDPSPISISGMDSQEYLLLHLLLSRGPPSDTYTWDADYTQIPVAGTSGGAADSNRSVTGGFRIATLTADTVDVTSDTDRLRYVQGLVALCEVEVTTEFPETPILDDFNRADEDPLDNGTWDTAHFAGTSSLKQARLLSNRAARENGSAFAESAGQWWLEEFIAPCQEVFMSLPVAETTDTRPGAGVMMLGHGSREDNNLQGIQVIWEEKVLSIVSNDRRFPHDRISFGKLTTVGNVVRTIQAWIDRVDGGGLGIHLEEPVTHLWVTQDGTNWFNIGAIYYTALPPLADPVVRGTLGLAFQGPDMRGDDFGGGACEDEIPQIIRPFGRDTVL